jgi:UPF0176 protein
MNYEVILYYHFSSIDDPDGFCITHKSLLKELGLKGRVYISSEGINGTLGGTREQIKSIKSISEAWMDLKALSLNQTLKIPFPLPNWSVKSGTK